MRIICHMVTLNKFRRNWLKYRKLPTLKHKDELRKVTPEHQFLCELLVSMGSWSTAELSSFLKSLGVTPPKRRANPQLIAARKVVYQVFDIQDDGTGLFCDIGKIEEVLKMARRRTKKEEIVEDEIEIEEEEDEEEEAPPKRRTRAKPKPKATTTRRRAKPKVEEPEEEDEEEDEAPKKRTRKKAAAGGGRKPTETVYVPQYEPVWDELEDGEGSTVKIPKDGRAFRGRKQKFIEEFLEGRGRKRTSAKMVIKEMVDEEITNEKDANAVVSHLINVGTLEVA